MSKQHFDDGRALRVAILGTRGIPAKYGGFETFTERLAIALVEQGMEVSVTCEEGSGTFKDYKGVHLIYCKATRLGPLTTILYDLRSLWAVRRGFDLVYMLGYGASFFCFIPRLWGSRVWINMDGLEWKRNKWGFVARKYFRIAEGVALLTSGKVIADAQAIADSLRGRFGTWFACNVLPYGCDIVYPQPESVIQEWDLRHGDYLLVVCRFEPENHVLEIIEAFTRSKSSKTLVLVGDIRAESPYVSKMRSIADPRIRFLGTIFDRRKLQALRFHCQVYLHGHSVGGTNPSLLEAMGCGNLIVAHNNCFNRETLGNYGLFFENVNELIGIVNSFEQESDTWEDMRAGARCRAFDLYSWESVLEKYGRLIRADVQSSGLSSGV
ncbi:MAG: DUF1972 domain-containing protein [Terracidiphilus sp.]